jgi:hypothetical protein
MNSHPIPPPRDEQQEIRRALFEILGQLTDALDEMRGTAVRLALTADKLDKCGGTLARIACAIGAPEPDLEDDQ